MPTFAGAWLASRPLLRRGGASDGFRRGVARSVARYARWSPLYRFELTGLEHLPREGPYVLVANHESGLDVLCLFLMETPARFLSEQWVARIPVVGPVFAWCDHIAMDPADPESRAAALEAAVASLEAGTPVAVFPEGHIPAAGQGPAPFRRGAFEAARRTGVPVVPVALEGTGRAWAPNTAVVEGTHRIAIQVLPALRVRDDEEPKEVAEAVRQRIAACLEGPAQPS